VQRQPFPARLKLRARPIRHRSLPRHPQAAAKTRTLSELAGGALLADVPTGAVRRIKERALQRRERAIDNSFALARDASQCVQSSRAKGDSSGPAKRLIKISGSASSEIGTGGLHHGCAIIGSAQCWAPLQMPCWYGEAPQGLPAVRGFSTSRWRIEASDQADPCAT
jgi:hypothetical protein